MKAVLLAAGLGTRLRPLTDTTPKIMLPVAYGVPLLAFQLRYLAQQGIDQIAINTHHLADQVYEYIDEGDWRDIVPESPEVHLFYEEHLRGTAGALLPMGEFLDEPFVVLYGDTLTNIDLRVMEVGHQVMRKGDQQITVACYLGGTEDKSSLRVDDMGRITSFVEKPDEHVIGLVNAGVYVMEPSAILHIKTGDDFGQDLFPRLIEDGWDIYAHLVSEATILDVGSPHRLARAEQLIRSGRV